MVALSMSGSQAVPDRLLTIHEPCWQLHWSRIRVYWFICSGRCVYPARPVRMVRECDLNGFSPRPWGPPVG
jgi:hypothetical protein